MINRLLERFNAMANQIWLLNKKIKSLIDSKFEIGNTINIEFTSNGNKFQLLKLSVSDQNYSLMYDNNIVYSNSSWKDENLRILIFKEIDSKNQDFLKWLNDNGIQLSRKSYNLSENENWVNYEDGEYNVKVKAQAENYSDSDFSQVYKFTKTPKVPISAGVYIWSDSPTFPKSELNENIKFKCNGVVYSSLSFKTLYSKALYYGDSLVAAQWSDDSSFQGWKIDNYKIIEILEDVEVSKNFYDHVITNRNLIYSEIIEDSEIVSSNKDNSSGDELEIESFSISTKSLISEYLNKTSVRSFINGVSSSGMCSLSISSEEQNQIKEFTTHDPYTFDINSLIGIELKNKSDTLTEEFLGNYITLEINVPKRAYNEKELIGIFSIINNTGISAKVICQISVISDSDSKLKARIPQSSVQEIFNAQDLILCIFEKVERELTLDDPYTVSTGSELNGFVNSFTVVDITNWENETISPIIYSSENENNVNVIGLSKKGYSLISQFNMNIDISFSEFVQEFGITQTTNEHSLKDISKYSFLTPFFGRVSGTDGQDYGSISSFLMDNECIDGLEGNNIFFILHYNASSDSCQLIELDSCDIETKTLGATFEYGYNSLISIIQYNDGEEDIEEGATYSLRSFHRILKAVSQEDNSPHYINIEIIDPFLVQDSRKFNELKQKKTSDKLNDQYNNSPNPSIKIFIEKLENETYKFKIPSEYNDKESLEYKQYSKIIKDEKNISLLPAESYILRSRKSLANIVNFGTHPDEYSADGYYYYKIFGNLNAQNVYTVSDITITSNDNSEFYDSIMIEVK